MVEETSGNIKATRQGAEKLADLADSLQKVVDGFKISSNSKRLGDYLVGMEYVTISQINMAIESQKSGQYQGSRLGDVLIAKGHLTHAQLKKAIEKKIVEDREAKELNSI